MSRFSSNEAKAEEKCVLALDVGGTKIEAGVVDADGSILTRRRISTPTVATDHELWGEIAALLTAVVAESPVPPHELSAAGCGTGGPMTLGGHRVSPLNIVAWRHFPLHRAMSNHLDDLIGGSAWHDRVFIDNDAKALALAEGWIGAAAGHTDYIAMVVSTGVGGGIVLNGRLLDGGDGNAGHIGHVIVVPEGGTPLPGHVPGTLEAEASGTAIAFRTGRPAVEASAAERERAGMLVGRAVGSVANLLDLKLAVVAGSVALGFGDRFFDAAQRELDRIARLDHSIGARIMAAGLDRDGPLVGAGAVAWHGLGRRLLDG